MEKIIFSKEETRKGLSDKCTDKVFLSGKETKTVIIELIEDYNQKIDSLNKDTESFLQPTPPASVGAEKIEFSQPGQTAQQYLNSQKATSRTKFFILKKYGLGSRPVDEWESIFRKEEL